METVDCLGIVPPDARSRFAPTLDAKSSKRGAGMAATDDGRHRLATLVRQQAAEGQCWERAETLLRAGAVRERLGELGIQVTPDVACAFMAAAMSMVSGTPEFGGDYRDALGDLAAVGLALLDG